MSRSASAYRRASALRPRALLVAAAILTGGAGCSGAQVTTLNQKVSDLTEEVSELRRGQAAQRVQFDEFRNRLVMLQDKFDSARVQQARVSPRQRVSSPQLDEPPRNLHHVVLPATAAQRAAENGSTRGGYTSRPIDRTPHLTTAQRPHNNDPRQQLRQDGPPASRSVMIGPNGLVRVSEAGGSASAQAGNEDGEPRASSRKGKSKKANKTSSRAGKGRAAVHGKARRHVPAGPGGTPHSAPPQTQTPQERAAGEYRAAKARLDSGQLREARGEFAAFLRDHPDHPLADNALYWMGETWYGQSLWLRAARVFGQVVERYPRGNKVPDAMLKTGLCYLNLGEQKLARDTFEQLLSMYPGTPTARIAQKKLTKMEGGS